MKLVTNWQQSFLQTSFSGDLTPEKIVDERVVCPKQVFGHTGRAAVCTGGQLFSHGKERRAIVTRAEERGDRLGDRSWANEE